MTPFPQAPDPFGPEERPDLHQQTAYVALGSNLGDSAKVIAQAALGLSRFGRVLAVSALYQTRPLGPPQPAYLNAAAALTTVLAPDVLLLGLKQLEVDLGRVPGPRWGPRLIDLDLLLLGERVFGNAFLRVPHPELARRAFVLVPLEEIAPEALHPELRLTVRALCAALPAEEVAEVRAGKLKA